MVQTMILYLLYDMIHDPYSYCNSIITGPKFHVATCNVTVSQDDDKFTIAEERKGWCR
jgi:hypothetical protein